MSTMTDLNAALQQSFAACQEVAESRWEYEQLGELCRWLYYRRCRREAPPVPPWEPQGREDTHGAMV